MKFWMPRYSGLDSIFCWIRVRVLLVAEAEFVEGWEVRLIYIVLLDKMIAVWLLLNILKLSYFIIF